MTKIINLDDIRKPTPVVIIVDGNRHELKTATVESFLENVKMIEEIGVNATVEQEFKAMIGIITRSFPTLTEKQIKQWSVEQLRYLVEVTRSANDEIVTTDEEEITEAKKLGNDQKAD